MLKNIVMLYRQGLMVAGCGISSAITLGYIWSDIRYMEKMDYDAKVKKLSDEIKVLKNTNLQ